MELTKMTPEIARFFWSTISSYQNVETLQYWKQCYDNRAFYEGKQYTDSEMSILQKKGQYTVCINKIRKAIKTQAGMVSASIPKYKLIPEGDEDIRKAEVGNQILSWVWSNSKGLTVFRQAIKSALIDNQAFLFMNFSKGKVNFKKLSFDEVLIDPAAKDPMYSDADMIVYMRTVGLDDAQKIFGQKISEEIPMYLIDNSVSGIVSRNFLSRVINPNKRTITLYECYRKEIIPINGGHETRIVKTILVGYDLCYREVLPAAITEYPIIPLYVEGFDNPYKKGEVHYLKEIQRFVNKTFGVMIYNAQMNSNPKAFVRETDIPAGDLEEFQETYNSPGRINVLSADGQPPIIVSGQQINGAFMTLFQSALMELEKATPSIDLQNFGREGQNHYSTEILGQADMALNSMQDFITVIEEACTLLGTVALQYVQGYCTEETIINITDANSVMSRIILNQKKGLDINEPDSVNGFKDALKQQGAKDEEIALQLKKAREDAEYLASLQYVMNDTDFSKFDVSVVTGSYSPNFRMSQLRLMQELVQSGAVDPSTIIDYLPFGDIENLHERFDTINVLNNKIADLEYQLKMKDKNIESLSDSIIQTQIGAAVAKNQTKLDKTYNQANIKIMRDKMKNQLDRKADMLELTEAMTIQKIQEAQKEAKQSEKTVANPSDSLTKALNMLLKE